METSADILQRMETISLEEMEGVKLLDRVEQKYVFHTARLPEVLSAIRPCYQVLEISGCRASEYETIYFDDTNFSLYKLHHSGRANRYKLRIRNYLNSQTSFYELKRKNNHKRTLKERICYDYTAAVALATDPFMKIKGMPVESMSEFSPVIRITFRRITLVSKTSPERVTIDTELKYQGGDQNVFPVPVCIAEIKQEKNSPSFLAAALHRMHVHPIRFSKYCYGVNLVYPEQKKNNFKPRNRSVEKIIQKHIHPNENHL